MPRNLNKTASPWLVKRTAFVPLVVGAFVLMMSGEAMAQQKYFTQNCQFTNAAMMGKGGYRVDHTIRVNTKKGPRKFYAARYSDGSGLFCISKPGGQNPSKIPVAFQGSFFNTVTQKGPKSVLVEIRDSQGRAAMITLYKLKFKNPNRPKVKIVKTWIDSSR